MSRPPSRTRANLRFSTLDGIFATPWTVVSLPGTFLMAPLLNDVFQIGPFWFGLVAAMPALANAIHILLVPGIARFLRVRDLTLGQAWLNSGLWLGGGVGIAFLPVADPATAGLFFVLLFGLSSLSGAFIGIGWSTWLADFVPERIRGRYLGQRNRYNNLTILAFMLAALLLLEGMDASRNAYLLLIAVAIAGRILSVLVQHLIVSPDPTGGALSHANWLREVGSLKREKPLLRFIAFGILFGFFGGMLGTATPLFALTVLGVSPAEFTGLSIAATVSGILFYRIWGQVIDRHGSLPTLILSLVLWKIGDFGWLAITPETRYWLFAVWIWGGATAAGYLLASFNLLLKLIPRRSRAAGVSINLAAASIAAAVSPVLTGFVLSHVDSWGWSSPTTYRGIILVGLLGTLLSLLLILRLAEPRTSPGRNRIPGAMRTLRQLTVSQGLAFFTNTQFIVRKKR